MTDNEKKAIDEFLQKINIEDSTQILQYGAKAQTKISQFSDNVLEGVKNKKINFILISGYFDESIIEEHDLLDYLERQFKIKDLIVVKDNKYEL